MKSPDSRNSWEDALDSALRNLPPRKAPASLEDRVLAAIAAHQAKPWWQKGFAFWPAAARVAFLVASAAVIVATVWFFVRGAGSAPLMSLQDSVGSVFRWWSDARSAMGGAARMAVDSLSPAAQFWMFAALGLVALCYATLIGTGAALYRIFVRPQ